MRKLMLALTGLTATSLLLPLHGAQAKDWAKMYREQSGLHQEQPPPKTPQEALVRSLTAVVKTKVQADDLRNSGVAEGDPEVQALVKKHDEAVAKTRELLAGGLNPAKISHPSTNKNLLEWFTFKNSKPLPLDLDYLLVELRAATRTP